MYFPAKRYKRMMKVKVSTSTCCAICKELLSTNDNVRGRWWWTDRLTEECCYSHETCVNSERLDITLPFPGIIHTWKNLRNTSRRSGGLFLEGLSSRPDILVPVNTASKEAFVSLRWVWLNGYAFSKDVLDDGPIPKKIVWIKEELGNNISKINSVLSEVLSDDLKFILSIPDYPTKDIELLKEFIEELNSSRLTQ